MKINEPYFKFRKAENDKDKELIKALLKYYITMKFRVIIDYNTPLFGKIIS